MIRNLKVLGLALVAVFALSAMAASMASASEFKSTGPWTGFATETGANRITAFGGTVECPGSTATVHTYMTQKETEEGKTHLKVTKNTVVITLTLDLLQTKCIAKEGESIHKTTVTLNGCDFDLVVPSKPAVRYAVRCPAGKSIQIDEYAFSGSELGGVVCTTTIGEQVELAGGEMTSNETGTLVSTGTVTGIKASRSGSGCATETTEKAEQIINLTTEGKNEAGSETAVELS